MIIIYSFIMNEMLDKLKKYPFCEIFLIFVFVVLSSTATMLFWALTDTAAESAGKYFSWQDMSFSYLQYAFLPEFIFIIPISPVSAAIVMVLIKKLTPNKKLINLLYKIKKSLKLKLLISVIFLLLPVALILLFFLLYSMTDNALLIVLILLSFMIYVFYGVLLIIYTQWAIEDMCKTSMAVCRYRWIKNKYFNNLFTQLLPVFAPVLGYWLCYVYFALGEEITFCCITPFLIFLIFYISLSNAQKLNDLIRYLYRHIVYVLIAFGAGIYYVNHSVVVSITSTNDTPAPMTNVVKFAMIIIALVMIFRLPLYKLHQRSKQMYKEAAEEDRQC